MYSEDQLIKLLKKNFNINNSQCFGIGDDCAIIKYNNLYSQLVSTDALIEDVHFVKKAISSKNLGYKAMIVNISDIAAMGGEPQYVLISLALPKNINKNWVNNFILGLKKAANEYNIKIIGGDTVRSSSKIFINVTIIGKILTKYIKYRHKAKLGDYIVLTGCVGDSGVGLKYLTDPKLTTQQNNLSKYFINKHNLPYAFVKEGRWLAKYKSVNAMLDVSDGVYSDTIKLSQSANCDISLYLEKLPISSKLASFCNKYKQDAARLAISGGEDYVLLCSIKAENFNLIAKKFQQKFNKKLYKIGVITRKNKKINNNSVTVLNNNKTMLIKQYFQHFG